MLDASIAQRARSIAERALLSISRGDVDGAKLWPRGADGCNSCVERADIITRENARRVLHVSSSAKPPLRAFLSFSSLSVEKFEAVIRIYNF